jgi:asparagine synthase (glutamine-hydrolysing)
MELIAQNGIKVTLDGQGADELFSGYPNHFYTSLCHDLSQFRFGNIRYAHRAEKEPMKNFARFLVRKSLNKWPFQAGYRYLKNSKFDFKLLKEDFWHKHANRYLQQTQTSSSHLNEGLYHEFTGTQLKYLMRTADRNSMRHSVESRLPFVDDHRLVEYVFSLPSVYKLHRGQSKFLLRESMKGKMPEAIRQRWDKKGFATPEAFWFKNMKGELKTMLDDNLSPFVDVKKLREEWGDIFAHQIEGNTIGISRFVILSMWRKKFGL